MSEGIPLNDDDRKPWIARIADWIETRCIAGRDGVISCSALKRYTVRRLEALKQTCSLCTYVAAENYSRTVWPIGKIIYATKPP